jgi:tRNA (guanine26-N2/guanine27-N2)-dimethyltransferase
LLEPDCAIYLPLPRSGLRVLDAMSGSGVRTLRYSYEVPNVAHVHANDLMPAYGDHPLQRNLQALIDQSRACVSKRNAVDLYMEARLGGQAALFDFVDCDAFGTGQPHTAEAWWAVRRGGLLYLCATDALTTAGNNAGKAFVGYGAVAPKPLPSCNEASVRMLMGERGSDHSARNSQSPPAAHACEQRFLPLFPAQNTGLGAQA